MALARFGEIARPREPYMKIFIYTVLLVMYTSLLLVIFSVKSSFDTPTNHYIQTSQSVKPPQPILSSWAGSATAVSHDGYYITAAHVVKGAMLIFISDKVSGVKHLAEVVAVDYFNDVAIIKSSPITRYFISKIDNTRIADKVMSCGYSLHSVFDKCSYSEGRIANVENGVAFNDAPINNGDSGSGVINDQGELIGVVSAKYVDENGAVIPKSSVFVASDPIKRLLESVGIFLPASNGHTLNQDSLTALISKSAVLVKVIGFYEEQ